MTVCAAVAPGPLCEVLSQNKKMAVLPCALGWINPQLIHGQNPESNPLGVCSTTVQAYCLSGQTLGGPGCHWTPVVQQSQTAEQRSDCPRWKGSVLFSLEMQPPAVRHSALPENKAAIKSLTSPFFFFFNYLREMPRCFQIIKPKPTTMQLLSCKTR